MITMVSINSNHAIHDEHSNNH